MARSIDNMPEDVLYQVCVMVLRDRRRICKVTEWLKQNGYPGAKREWPRQILVRAYEIGILVLPSREHHELGLKIGANSNTVCRVAMAEDSEDAAFDLVAGLAADQTLKLIRCVQEARKERRLAAKEPALAEAQGGEVEEEDEKQDNGDEDEVHIGFPGGATSHAFNYHLVRMLRGQPGLPKLVLHTLTSGCSIENPSAAPVSSLAQFDEIEPKPEYVVLFSPPVVSRNEAASVRGQPITKNAFEAAAKIDIIVTSIGVADHEHNLFNYAVGQMDPENSHARLQRLRALRWAGDIMWQPYSTTAEPLDCDVEAVSLLGFQDLVNFAHGDNTYVVCIAGPCATCHETKKDALLPLLRCPAGRRPFSHLITTASTARAMCAELDW